MQTFDVYSSHFMFFCQSVVHNSLHLPRCDFGSIQVWIIVPSPLNFAYLSSELQQLEDS